MPSVFIVIRFPLFFLVFPQTESQASTHSWGQVENEGPGAAMARMRWFRVTAAALTLLAGGCVPQASFEVAAVAAPQPPNEPPDEPQAMQARLIPQRQNIRRFACFAAAAYDSNALPASCNPYLAGWVLRDLPATVPLLFNLHYPGKYIVAMNHKTHEQIVAIRGTDNAQDWVTNFKIEQTFDPILRVKVHSGFAEYARAVRTAVQQTNLLVPTYKTYITGHSLGGAAAVILGLYWYVDRAAPDHYDIAGIYTYGQPKPFNNQGGISWPDFAQKIYRVEDCDDAVPLLPTGGDLFHSVFRGTFLSNEEAKDYQHIGQPILLMDNGMYWMPGGNEVYRNRVREIDDFITDAHYGQPLDHNMTQYAIRIDQLFAGPARPTNPVHQLHLVCSRVARPPSV